MLEKKFEQEKYWTDFDKKIKEKVKEYEQKLEEGTERNQGDKIKMETLEAELNFYKRILKEFPELKINK
ncbi:MAG: hypothetical protein J5875_13355 [Paludibacteraceae bacterium]|nr:hypothetical protein [Paludibacteraceae bacterium]